MAKVQRAIDVAVPIEAMWAVITDYEKYPAFLKDVKRVTTRNRQGSTVEVTTEISVVGTTVSYTLRMAEQQPSSLTWSLVEGQFMKSNEGAWKLESLGPNSTRAEYRIEISVGLLVPKTIIGALVDSNLPQMLSAFKNRAETLPKK